MSIDEINKLSLPMLNRLIDDLPKRICEKLGVPYDEEEEEEVKQQETKITTKEEPQYPSRKVEKLLAKRKTVKTDSNIYDASDKQQFIDFFAGLADVKDTT